MAQGSFPQGGFFDPVTLPDSGPYSADEWAALLGVFNRAGVVLSTVGPLQVDTAFNDVGVFYAVANRLEVTSAGANTININTGAAMVAGRVVPSDTALVFTVPINRTNDLIVVRQNWSAATYVPPGSVDADEEVPPDTARVTRVTALVNDATLATYWDIPLADFTTDGAGAVTLNSDDRVWVDAEVKTHFEPAISGYNGTLVATIAATGDPFTGFGVNLPTNNQGFSYGRTTIPQNYISGFEAAAVFVPLGNGNISVSMWLEAGQCGELASTHQVFGALQSGLVVATGFNECSVAIAMATVAVGDIVGLWAERLGTDGGDTLAQDIRGVGFIINYLGWGRR